MNNETTEENEIGFLRLKLQETEKKLKDTNVYLSEERSRRNHLEFLQQGAIKEADFKRLATENTRLTVQAFEMRQHIRELELKIQNLLPRTSTITSREVLNG